MPDDKPTIAVLGAGGTMGFPIARNLVRAGFPVRAWNRSLDKAQPLSDDGAELCSTPAEAVSGADVIVTMLADADAVIETVADALSGEHRSDAIWLQMSTIGLEGTERCIELAHEHNLAFVDVPVLGTRKPAQDAELVVMASGPNSLHLRLEDIFEAIGQRTMWVGEAGVATRLKLATNAWIVTVVEGTAETLALAEGLGLDPQLVLDALSGGTLDLPYFQMKGKAIIERDFEPSFRLKLAAKDAALVAEAARRHRLELPMLETIRDRLREGADEHPDEDMIATYLTSAPAA